MFVEKIYKMQRLEFSGAVRSLYVSLGVKVLIKVKVKRSRYRPGLAQRVGRGIALLFHDRDTRTWVSGQQHHPAVFYLRERPGTHFTGGWVGPNDRSGGAETSSPAGIRSRTVQPHSSVTIPTELPGTFH